MTTAAGPAQRSTCDFDVLSVRDVSRRYGRRRALAGVSFDCHASEVLGVFGPNGAGKSTLLGILATLAQPTSGDVRYGDRTADAWGDALRGRIGVLGHDLFLYADLSAKENLAFFARLYGLSNVDARVARALEAAGLAARSADRVGGYSRGMRQRLALERALLHDPRLVILDEPFTGLDDESAARLATRLREQAASGAMVVMATHDFDLAAPVIDHALCLKDGRAITLADGNGSLRERYRTAVAGPAS